MKQATKSKILSYIIAIIVLVTTAILITTAFWILLFLVRSVLCIWQDIVFLLN